MSEQIIKNVNITDKDLGELCLKIDDLISIGKKEEAKSLMLRLPDNSDIKAIFELIIKL